MKTAGHQIKGMLHISRNLQLVSLQWTTCCINITTQNRKINLDTAPVDETGRLFSLTNARQHIKFFSSIKWMEQNNVTNWSQKKQVTNYKSLLLSLNVAMQHKQKIKVILLQPYFL
jgi:hypothetical protein